MSKLQSKDPVEAAKAVVRSLRSHADDFERWIKAYEEETDPAKKECLRVLIQDEIPDFVEFFS